MLIRKYDVGGPRYTSYPTADRFIEALGEADLQQCLARRDVGGISQPLSLYVHLPFGHDRGQSAKYIKYLEKELALLAPHLAGSRAIHEMHWSGTPNFSGDEMAALVHAVESHLSARARAVLDRDRSAPRRARAHDAARRPRLRPRLDRRAERRADRARDGRGARLRRRSVNLDLVYGLPKQTLDRFQRTLDEVLRLAPDRIALTATRTASAELKLQLLTLAIGRLTRAGYLYIGMEPRCRATSWQPRNRAASSRAVQGYSTQSGDVLALGVSAIGQIGAAYYQNCKDLERYYAALDAGRLPVLRGLALTADDLVRRAVIHALMCNFRPRSRRSSSPT